MVPQSSKFWQSQYILREVFEIFKKYDFFKAKNYQCTDEIASNTLKSVKKIQNVPHLGQVWPLAKVITFQKLLMHYLLPSVSHLIYIAEKLFKRYWPNLST